MDGNGADRYAALEARVAELEASLRILARRWEEELTPRLADMDRDMRLISTAIAEYLDR